MQVADNADSKPVNGIAEGGRKWVKNRKFRIFVALAVIVLVAVGLLVGLLVPKSRSGTGAAVEQDVGAPSEDVEDVVREPPEDGGEDTVTGGNGDSTKQPREPWPHDEGDIPADPAVSFGTLDNGFKYAIMANSEPPGRLSLRLHVAAGSLHEEDDQLGIAHFLEHMMFNGLRSFPDPEDLVDEMQRLGVEFGRHLNAYTSFDETVYMLDLPGVENYTVDLGFKVLRDWADGCLLNPDEIEKERGVVLSEMTLRDSVERRIMLQQLEFLAPDHRITRRDVIGTKEVLSTAPRERFLDFYRRFYVPSRMTLIAVGDLDGSSLKDHIHGAFKSMSEPEEVINDPDMGTIPFGIGFRTASFVDKQLSYDMLSIDSVLSHQSEPDTKAERMRQMSLALAHSALNRRFHAIAKEEGSLILDGGVMRQILAQAMDWGGVYAIPLDGRWEEAVPVLEQEVRRALEHGFSVVELDEVKAGILDRYDEAVKRAPSRRSKNLADRLVGSVGSRRVFSSPEESLRIMEKMLAEATPQLVRDAFREYWNRTDLSLLLAAREAPADAADKLMVLHEESKAVEVAPLEETSVDPFGYTYFGPSGTILADDTVDDLNIRQLVLSNNVRVNMKRTTFRANSILISAQFGTGRIGQPRDLTWLDRFAEVVITQGGLGKHTAEELERILAGKTVSLGFSVRDGTFSLAGSTAPDDLELQLQLLAAVLSDPGYRETQFHNAIPVIMSQLKHTLNGALNHVMAWLWGGDGRFAVPTEEGLNSLEVSHVVEWIHSQLIGGYLEVSLVGDFDPEAAIPLLLDTLGALPDRADTPPEIGNEAREVSFPATTPDSRIFTYETEIPQAATLVVWRVPALLGEDVRLVRRLNLLARILSDRLYQRIREDLGESYSPQAMTMVSDAFDHGMILAMSPGALEDSGPTIDLILSIAENITHDATEDELVRAIKPFQTILEESLRDNSYWLGVMEECQSKPHVLDWSRQRDDDYVSISLEEIKALAAQYLAPDDALRIEVLPVMTNETGATGRRVVQLDSIFGLPELFNVPDPFGVPGTVI